MGSYRIEWRSSARRELRRLSPSLVARIVEAVGTLGTNPRPVGCRKLAGSEHTYRIRIGSYRVVYEIHDVVLVVEVVRVRHRRDVYR
jgi:mRNA interferase RelE/StbE